MKNTYLSIITLVLLILDFGKNVSLDFNSNNIQLQDGRTYKGHFTLKR